MIGNAVDEEDPVERALPDCFTAVAAAAGLDLHGHPSGPSGQVDPAAAGEAVRVGALLRTLGDAVTDEVRRQSRSEAQRLAGIALMYQAVVEAGRARRLADQRAPANLPASDQAELAARGAGGRGAKDRWFTDDMQALAAEVGALCGVGTRAAEAAVDLATKLRYRHPRLWQLLHAGVIQLRHVRAAVAAAEAVLDPDLVDRFDALLATRLAHEFARDGAVLTANDVKLLASRILAKLDPDAEPLPPATAPRSARFTRRRDGSVELVADFDAIDGLFAAEEVERVARTACRRDGRSLDRRRSDALIALLRGFDSLGCRCGDDECEWAERKPRAGAVAETGVQVRLVLGESTLAGQDDEPGLVEECGTLPEEVIPAGRARDLIEQGETVFDTFGRVEDRPRTDQPRREQDGNQDGDQDGDHDGDQDGDQDGDREAADAGQPTLFDPDRPTDARTAGAPPVGADHQPPVDPEPSSEPAPDGDVSHAAASVPDAGRIPPALAGRRPGTRQRVIATEPNGYRPSALQAEYVVLRHGHCVFPGCTVKSRHCQLDHAVEYLHSDPQRGGRTAVSNLIPLCGRHHRLKTEQEWLPILGRDGRVEWHSPDGRIYTTGGIRGTEIFPDLDTIEWVPGRHRRAPHDPNIPPRTSRAEQQNLRRQARREKIIRTRNATAPPGDRGTG